MAAGFDYVEAGDKAVDAACGAAVDGAALHIADCDVFTVVDAINDEVPVADGQPQRCGLSGFNVGDAAEVHLLDVGEVLPWLDGLIGSQSALRNV